MPCDPRAASVREAPHPTCKGGRESICIVLHSEVPRHGVRCVDMHNRTNVGNEVLRGPRPRGPLLLSPATHRRASRARMQTTLTRREEPAAFGCSAITSPLRPIPWARPRQRSCTSGQAMRASLSPTPAFPARKASLHGANANGDRAILGSYCFAHPPPQNLEGGDRPLSLKKNRSY